MVEIYQDLVSDQHIARQPLLGILTQYNAM